MSGPEFNPQDDEPIDREEWEKAMRTESAPPTIETREQTDAYEDRIQRAIGIIEHAALLYSDLAEREGSSADREAAEQLSGLVDHRKMAAPPVETRSEVEKRVAEELGVEIHPCQCDETCTSIVIRYKGRRGPAFADEMQLKLWNRLISSELMRGSGK